MGKFGGREVTYGADLDVLFVGNESGTAQKLLSTLAQPSAEGGLSRVDARLRPEGEKGPLVCTLESFESYFRSRAQPWELQALSRARPVAGPQQEEFMAIAKRAWQTAGRDPDLNEKIESMLERIRRERGSGSDFLDFKAGVGGIIEAEFLVQALQMRAEIWEPNWNRAVDLLREKKTISKGETLELKGAYKFLRRCESVLRRHENSSIAALPADPNEQTKLARRLGCKNLADFSKKYEGARAAVHKIYIRRITKSENSPAF